MAQVATQHAYSIVPGTWRLGRGRPVISVEDKPPQKVDLLRFNPDKKLVYSRTTPGQTNRIIEDRFPDSVFPNNNLSFGNERPDTDVTDNTPDALRRQEYIQLSIFSALMVGLFLMAKS